MTYEELKRRILEFRIKHNLTQIEMCEKLEVAELTYIRFMKDRGNVRDITKIKIEQKLKELEEND